MRIYDPRLGRFLSVDPITRAYPELTPYQFASNTPIQGIDLDGLEILKINSSAYRMKYLGTFPVFKKQTVETIQVNDVETIHSKLPDDYEPIPNVMVGTTGENQYIPPGPTIKVPPEEPYLGDDDGETVQKTERTVKTQGGKTARVFRKVVVTESVPQKAVNAGNGIVAPQELWKIGEDISNGVKSFKDMLINVKEEKLRDAFYRATRIVDGVLQQSENANYVNGMSKIADIGAFRADLINYITDGTMPSHFKGDAKQQGYYQSEVLRVGDVIMKDNNIEKRSAEH